MASAMLTIWGRLNSINVQKVVWMAEECGLRFERIDTGGAFGGNRTPEYLAMNPNGLVPVIKDGQTILWESNTILRYLAAKHGGASLWPASAAERARADMWMDWASTELYPAYAPAFMGLVRTAPDKRDPAAIEAARAKTETKLAILEAQLAKSSHIAGDRFSIGDICVGLLLHRWLNMPIERLSHPAIEAWHAKLSKRPAAQTVMGLPVT
jgi:glutathione S-transferase